jgi:hypothetical protein
MIENERERVMERTSERTKVEKIYNYHTHIYIYLQGIKFLLN